MARRHGNAGLQTGTAARRATKPHIAKGEEARGRLGALGSSPGGDCLRQAPAPEPPGASRRESQLPPHIAYGVGAARLILSAAASCDSSLLFCERGESPLSHIPPKTRAANGVRRHQFLARSTKRPRGQERWAVLPVGPSDRHRPRSGRNSHRQSLYRAARQGMARRHPPVWGDKVRVASHPPAPRPDIPPKTRAANGVCRHQFFARWAKRPQP